MTFDLGLTAAQHAALDHARTLGAAARPAALERIARILGDHDLTTETSPQEVAQAPVERSVIVLNFHPDRIAADGRVVMDALHDDGIYRSQFETGISNGGLTAFPGGDRDRWEERMFGGAYQQPQTTPAERPKYGTVRCSDEPSTPRTSSGRCSGRDRPRRHPVARWTPTSRPTCTVPSISTGSGWASPADTLQHIKQLWHVLVQFGHPHQG